LTKASFSFVRFALTMLSLLLLPACGFEVLRGKGDQNPGSPVELPNGGVGSASSGVVLATPTPTVSPAPVGDPPALLTTPTPTPTPAPAEAPVVGSRLSTSVTCTPAQRAASPFAQGSGTLASPYVICTPQQLFNVANHLSGVFVLATNLDLNGLEFNGIGAHETPFTGLFDGNFKTISNYSRTCTAHYCGLFNAGKNFTVRNLAIRNVTINASTFATVGLLLGTGLSGSSTIERVVTEGSIVAYCTEQPCGGMGGIAGGFGEGDFSGHGAAGVLRNSTADFHLTGDGPLVDCGGLVGFNNSLIENSYSTGELNVPNSAWGIGGIIGGSFAGYWANSFSTATIVGRGMGLIGNPYSPFGENSLMGTAEAFQNPSHEVYNGTPTWDFVSTWQLTGSSLPTLRGF